jgi:hypothetical protein
MLPDLSINASEVPVVVLLFVLNNGLDYGYLKRWSGLMLAVSPRTQIPLFLSEIGKCPLNVVYEELHNTIITIVLEINPQFLL